MYDYRKAMIENIEEELYERGFIGAEDLEEAYEELYDDLWTEDNVTGNGSGSYTFNRCEAKEYVTDNMDLCIEALKEFCIDSETIAEKFLCEDWEYFDVTIRCYLLGECLSEVLEGYKIPQF